MTVDVFPPVELTLAPPALADPALEAEAERLRILAALRSELRHDLNGSMASVRASVGLLERLAAALAELSARVQSGGTQLLAQHPDPQIAEFYAETQAYIESEGVDLLLEKFGLLVNRVHTQADRVLRLAEALLVFCAGDGAAGGTDVDEALARASALVSGWLRSPCQIVPGDSPVPRAQINSRDLLLAVVADVMNAAVPEQSKVTLRSAFAPEGPEIRIEIEAAGAAPGAAGGPLPDPELAGRLLAAHGGRLTVGSTPAGRRDVLHVEALR